MWAWAPGMSGSPPRLTDHRARGGHGSMSGPSVSISWGTSRMGRFTPSGSPIEPMTGRSSRDGEGYPPVSNNLKRLIHSKFQLDCRCGVGTDGNQLGQQPTVMLRYSDDGGYTWSSEKWAPLGRIGQTLSRAIWRRLGFSRNRVYEVTVTDPVDVAIMGADLDAQPCAS